VKLCFIEPRDLMEAELRRSRRAGIPKRELGNEFAIAERPSLNAKRKSAIGNQQLAITHHSHHSLFH
jgi:hypothetical protein